MKAIRLLLGTLLVFLSATVLPGGLQAATWQVDAAGSGDFLTIQAAIDNAAAGDVINVAAGHYVEQLKITTDDLTISGAGIGATYIDSPAQLLNYFIIGNYYFPVVLVENCDGVGFSNLTLDGLMQGDTNPLFQGFGYFNAGGWLDNVNITGVRGATLNAMPHGNGAFVVATDGLSHTFDMTDVQVADFQKSGVVLDGTNLSGTLTRVTVTGAGTTGVIAQNGIQVSRDAAFSLNDCVTTDLNYTGGIWSATGFLGTSGTSVTMDGCQAATCQNSIYMEDNMASFANGLVTNPQGDALVSSSSGAKALLDRLVPQPVDIAVAKLSFNKSAATMSVTNSVITGTDLADSWGVAVISAGLSSLTMDDCEISHFDRGFVIFENGGAVTGQARNNDFVDNLTVAGWSNSVVDYDARQNWWGHISGPFHPTKNAAGLGFVVTDHILFDPWSFAGPGIVATVPDPGPFRCGLPHPVTVTYLPDPLGPPTRGYEITFRITGPGFATESDVTDAGGLGNVGTHQFYVADNGDGTITVSDALLGPSVGLSTIADVFVINVQTTGDGVVGVEFVSNKLRDLNNQPLYAPMLGTSFVVDCIVPAPVTAIDATPGHNKVLVTWSHDDVDVDHYEVYRGLWHDGIIGQSAYPEYDDVSTGYPATRPATWADADADPEWEFAGVASVGTHTFTDTWADNSSRGVYYYEVYAVDPVLNGDAAVANDRSTNYWLGDVAGGAMDPEPNGLVNVFDITELGTHFGNPVPLHDPANVLDVGPTDDWSRVGIPTTDDVIDFEDLIVFSMNFNVVSAAKDRGPISNVVDLAWVSRDDGAMVLRLVNGTGLKGLRVQASQPVTLVTAGQLLGEQQQLTFLKNVGSQLDANIAVMGVSTGFAGTGDLIVVKADSPITAEDLTITARGIDNSKLTVSLDKLSTGGVTPRVYALHGNYPNPFNPMTTISFSLPEAQDVKLVVYGVDGRRVAVLVDGQQGPGLHEVIWTGRDDNGRSVATGTYFYRLEAGPYRQVQKMTLIK